MSTGFIWKINNFLHWTLYDAMFCSCDQNSVDNTGVLQKIQFMTTFIIKKQAKWYWFYPCHFYVNSCTNFGSHKLSFHQVTFMGLCFGLVTKIKLILQGYFSYQWAVLKENWGIFCFFCHSAGEGAGSAQEIGKGCGQNSWPWLIKGVSHAT